MKIDILTLFPNMFSGFVTSIIKKAVDYGYLELNIHDIRMYTKNAHKKVDDYGFGGGVGMVLMIEPIAEAIKALRGEDTLVIMMTPQGIPYKQKMAYELTKQKHIILLCGHYEGFDERIRSLVDMEISIGDYVLTGGEIASMVITDSVVRLIDGVIERESHLYDSFNHNLLDYPVYTKPRNFEGMEVPEILFSGHHENIRKWREEASLKRTQLRRPDLLEKE